MENREIINKEALLNKALESEFSDDNRYDTLMDVAQDYLRDKLYYLGCAKIYEEAGNSELADEYMRRAEWVDEAYLEPLGKILGEIKLSIYDMEEEDVREIEKYFGREYLDYEDDQDG